MSSSFKEVAVAQKNVEMVKQLKEQGSLNEAITKYKIALKMTLDNVPALVLFSSAYAAQENREEVVNCCRKIIAFQPNNSRAYLQKARALKQQNKIYGALAAFQEAIEIDKEVLTARYYKELGELFVQLKSSENQQAQANDAIATYQKAIELDWGSVAAYQNLGNGLRQKGLLNNAINCYQKAIKLNPNASVYIV